MTPHVLALGLLAFAGPAAAGVSVQPSLPLTETGTFTGAATLPVGETLLVVLPGQAGTGYAWELRPVEGRILERQGAHCAGARPAGRAGGSEPACFAWAARAPGAATLTFVYHRQWETTPDRVLRYDLSVTVEPPR
jgi:predicted secreted protein